jgi:CBS domain-containing protein
MRKDRIMSKVQTILEQKGRTVWTVGKDVTVLQAVLLMNERKVGAVVVTEGGRIAGMFTERDLLRRVVGEQRDPARTTVAEVMTEDVVCGSMDTPLDEASSSMKNRRFRHLPVVDDEGHLLGLVSIGDLNAYREAVQEQTIFMLHEYMHGRV